MTREFRLKDKDNISEVQCFKSALPANCDCGQNLIEAARPAERQTRNGHHWLRSISLTHLSCSPQNKMGWLCEANFLIHMDSWGDPPALGPSAGTRATSNLEGLWVAC